MDLELVLALISQSGQSVTLAAIGHPTSKQSSRSWWITKSLTQKELSICRAQRLLLFRRVYSKECAQWTTLTLSRSLSRLTRDPIVIKSSKQEKQLVPVEASSFSVMIAASSSRQCQARNSSWFKRSYLSSTNTLRKIHSQFCRGFMASIQSRCKTTKKFTWCWWATPWDLIIKTTFHAFTTSRAAPILARSKVAFRAPRRSKTKTSSRISIMCKRCNFQAKTASR